MALYNPELMRLAQKRASAKQAFVPGDPAAAAGGGAPPMDPAMMGGGGAPMDPAMMGGAPPMDPAMMGGAPPMDPAMMGGGAPPPPPAPAPAPAAPAAPAADASGKPPKPDINTVAMDIWQVKKLLEGIYHRNEWPLPQGLIDGPNRDPSTGSAVPPGTPGSTSDMAASAPPQGGGGDAGGAIPAMQPMGAASFGGGGEKTSHLRSDALTVGVQHETAAQRASRLQVQTTTMSKAAALAHLVQGLALKQEEQRRAARSA